MTEKSTRVVVCAANKFEFDGMPIEPVIICGVRHYDSIMHDMIKTIDPCLWNLKRTCTQGFLDQRGVFMTRDEAFVVATAAGQIGRYRPKSGSPGNTVLYSEDIY